MLRLGSATDPAYVDVVLGDLDAVLVDHAHCEHKAAVTALSFVSKYPDDPRLVTSLAQLARDEADHFARVAQICIDRGLSLGHPLEHRYAKELLQIVRGNVLEQRVDRLLGCALIEGRSCERLQMIARALDSERGRALDDANRTLSKLYDELWREEAEHHTLFIELAERTLSRAGDAGAKAHVEARLHEMAAHEARVVAALPLRAAIH
jgi:tRNA 2-(methylsulfanyl)-N6-isopentenyladenosine37 hydroxylase